MTFVDISMVPVRDDRRAAYLAFSRRMADVYRDHGATRVVDFWQAGGGADQSDFHAEGTDYAAGQLRDLGSVVGARGGESVVITVTEWPSRSARDRGTAAATSDPRVLATLEEDPVFDGARVVAESFEVALDVSEQE